MAAGSLPEEIGEKLQLQVRTDLTFLGGFEKLGYVTASEKKTIRRQMSTNFNNYFLINNFFLQK